MKNKYTDEFKLSVVLDYYSSSLGVRAIAMKYNLPSKNYITNWEQQLIKKGLIPPESAKPVKAVARSKESIMREDTRTPREKVYEQEIELLKARVEYLESLDSLKPFLKKKRIREVKYEVILELSYKYPIWVLCETAGVTKVAYYKFKRKKLKNSDSESLIENLILQIHSKSGKRKGYRAIKDDLKRVYNLIVNHKKILRIMRENKICSVLKKKSKRTKEQSVSKEDLLKRDFTSSGPGKKFVTDITYIPTRLKMIYLCTVIDLFNNEPVAWKISDCQDKNLSISTIETLSKKFDLSGSVIHSDQGVQYTNLKYVDLLQKLEVKQSMSRKGNCWDNAKAESFFGHYKTETIHLMKRRLKDIHEVVEITEEYMKYYIYDRPQRKLNGYPPGQFKNIQLSANFN